MSETQKIERATATGFLALYNAAHCFSFQVTAVSDSPDVQCADEAGEQLNLEITLTEDEPRDTQAALGRSSHRDIDNFDPAAFAASSSADAATILVCRLQNKFQKRYGANTALVIRSASGVDWDWDVHLDEVRRQMNALDNPFDRGVWLLNRQMDRLFCIYEASGAV